MLYDLVFHLNLIHGISNQLGMVTIITLFPFDELCISSLDKPLVNTFVIFFIGFT
jgi:hypothetical protein